MPVYKVNVKWNSKKFNDLEIDTDASPQDFKALLFSLTGVPPDRQKVMMPGGLLGDTSYDKIRLRNGATVMLMGSVDEPPCTTSVESANPVAQFRKDRKKPSLPVGIVNLGNTCYMNSALQLLFTIPEFRAFLKILPAESLSSMNLESRNVVNTLRLTFELLERTNEPVVPFAFLDALHAAFPQFATLERGDSNPIGGISRYQQQDANECWIEIVRVLQQVTLDSNTLSSSQNIPESFGTAGGWNLVSRFLTGRLVSTLTCTEGDEPPQESVDTFSQLSCFIDKDVKYLHTGLRNGLEGTLTKNSESLGREAVYKKVSQISRLPGYLCVQFIRFFYKEKNQVNAKVLKDVKFPLSLDLYEFCSKDLQAKLLPQREKARAEDEAEAMAVKARKVDASREEEPSNPEDNPELYDPYWLSDDLGSNATGLYELQGVLSHQGRKSVGHYVAWIKRRGSWFKMDDQQVSETTDEEILKLSGGGEWHSAYLLLYGPRRVKKTITTPRDA